MATELVELEGIASWAKVFGFNKDNNEEFHGEGGAYTIDVLLEKDQLDKLTKSGSRLKPKIGDEGISIRFKRKHLNPVEPLWGGPPKVVTADKYPFPGETLIGNGSKVMIYVTIYDTKLGKGTRLEGIQVLDLVTFESEEGMGGGVHLPF